jgi:ribokinase
VSTRPKIVVIGSLNIDHTLRVPRIPAPGETLTASSAFMCFGGKGANQAVAAARAGGDVTLIGCVGDDDFGSRYIEHLLAEGIHTDAIKKAPATTGSAFITVDDAGENSIVVNPGANHALQPHHLDVHAAVIRAASVLLLQLECPLPSVLHAISIAAAARVPTVLNPSPLTSEFTQTGQQVDTLIVNEHEAANLIAMPLTEIEADSKRALTVARCRQLIITRGGDPTIVITTAQTFRIAPPHIVPVDTVGAGDTFAGAFAVARADATPLDEAIRFANAAGALATQKAGAQPAIPKRDAIIAFMRSGALHALGSQLHQ